ncbi:MAG: hypothetical protein ACRD3E_15805 [Terriglobales bacterium]
MAGIAGFKRDVAPANASAMLLRDWVDNDTFTWIMTAEILEEYAAVLATFAGSPLGHRSRRQSAAGRGGMG